ncbi:MAG: hypothetical protein NUW00_01220 [Candidatus Kaiserbacteria bacterium]|nr:hypothetical protein [Candidatus Kaiserbacteria bacterium]
MNIFETVNEGEEETTTTEVDESASEEESEEEGEEIAEEGEDGKQSSKSKDAIDYKAKFESLQKKVAGDAFKKREAKHKETGDDDGEEDDSKPLTKAELKALLDERDSSNAKNGQAIEAMTLAKTLTESDDEAQYAVELFKHITLPFDTLEENMRFIIGGMNAERLIGQTEEVKRALKSKETARKNTAITVRDKASGSQPAISSDVKAVLKAQGYKYLSEKKAYGKKLANGKMLFSDGKGKTWVE